MGLALSLVIAVLAAAAAGCGLFGPSAAEPEAAEPGREPLPLSQADGLWQEVTATATGVSPVLQPGYLPPGLDEVQVLSLDVNSFSVEYLGEDCLLDLAASGPSSLPMTPEWEAVSLTVRSQAAHGARSATDDAKAELWFTWLEPGRWVADETYEQEVVHYFVRATGLDLEEVLRFAEELGTG